MDVQGDPLGPRRNQADVVLPRRRFQGLQHHVGEQPGRRGRAEVGIRAMTDGADHPRRVRIAGQDDARLGRQVAHLPQQFQAVEPVAAGAGHQHVARRLAQARRHTHAAGDILDTALAGFQHTGQQFVDGRAGIDKQEALSAHSISITLL